MIFRKKNSGCHTLFISEYFLPTIGGSITVYENIYRYYPANTVWILTKKVLEAPRSEVKNGIHIRRTAFPLHSHSKVRMAFLYMWVLWLTFLMVKQNRITEIHCDKALTSGLAGWLASRLLRIPYFVYAHGEDITIESNYPLHKKWMIRIYQDAKGIFANSHFTASLLRELGIAKEKIGVIGWGVPREMLNFPTDQKMLREKYGVNGSKVILTVSRLGKRKGHAFVLKALHDLRPQFGQFHYLIAGEGEERKHIEQYVRDFALQDNVSFLGEVKEKELLELYSICDLFVMPNITLENGEVEGYGIVFLEAAAFGKPAIGGKSGGTSDIIIDGQTGYLVDPSHPEELKNRIQDILQHPDLANRLGQAARYRIADYFTWDKVFQRFEDFRDQRLEVTK